MVEYSSSVDTWLLLVLLTSIVVGFIGARFLFKLLRGYRGFFSAVLLLLVCGVLPIWLLLDTKYYIDRGNLIVRSGPRVWMIPITSITLIEPSRDTRSSPALSLDRLKIYYGNGEVVLVSPEDKIGFLKALGRSPP